MSTRPATAAGAAGTAAGATAIGGGGFEGLAPDRLVRAFGVDYAHVEPASGGDLYVTRHGWPFADALDPARWYAGEWYERAGTRLRGATGTVYHVRPRDARPPVPDFVVKFSRVAQDVPLLVETSFPADVPPEVISAARFNSPLEEFGLLEELRRGSFGGPHRRMPAQRPLAIYVPPEEFDLWQLGRHTSSFHSHRAMLAEDQSDSVKAIELDIRRIYVLLFGWLEGRDAEECFHAGLLPEPGMLELTARVTRELHERGFRVLDNKPKHFILRPRADGALLRRRDGSLVYGLVDYELLQRSPEHQHAYRAARREQYWHRPPGPRPPEEPPPSHLKDAVVFGVEYAFGATPDGGRLWVVGRERGLFDFFLPDRWRRTPREKLSATAEVYRTRTRDQADIVYRRSRVGFLPLVDPRVAAAKAIREWGYNSPFEEVALAERLREMGVPTVNPRAIYETGHATVKPLRLRDPRRFLTHAELCAPGSPALPVLRPDHDYYTLWDTWRGADPALGAAGTVSTLDSARESGLVTAEEAREALAHARRSLERTALPGESVADDEFVVMIDAGGAIEREGGLPRLYFSLDALTACDRGLLGEPEYLEIMTRLDERLGAVDFAKLDPTGRHLLVTVDSRGEPVREASGAVHAVLCNFALIRGLYRPIR